MRKKLDSGQCLKIRTALHAMENGLPDNLAEPIQATLDAGWSLKQIARVISLEADQIVTKAELRRLLRRQRNQKSVTAK